VLGFAAAHQDLGIVRAHGERGQTLLVLVLRGLGHFDVGDEISTHGVPSEQLRWLGADAGYGAAASVAQGARATHIRC